MNRAITESVREALHEQRADLVQIYASHLSAAQLNAAIGFAESPEGRAITAATDKMTGEMAQFGNAVATRFYQGFAQRFCPTHKDVCEAGPAPSSPATETVVK